MKTKFFIVSLSLLLHGAVWAQDNAYQLNVHIKGISVSDKAYLFHGSQLDSTEIATGGTFYFSGNVAKPGKAYLLFGPNVSKAQRNPHALIYLEPAILKVEGQIDSLSNLSIQGGGLNADYQHYKELLKPVADKSQELADFYQKTEKKERETLTYLESYEQRRRQIEMLKQQLVRDFIKQYPNSLVSLDVIIETAGYSPDIEYIESAYQLLGDGVKGSEAGQQYAKEIETFRKTRQGAEAPLFSMTDTLGNMVSLSDFRGKYVLIDFWASWCGPCREENPNVVQAYHEFKDKGFTVLGVSLDNEKGRKAWIKAIHDDKLEWTQVSDLKGWKNQAAVLYAIKGIPQNFLLNPEGVIIAKNLRGKKLEEKLKEILN